MAHVTCNMGCCVSCRVILTVGQNAGRSWDCVVMFGGMVVDEVRMDGWMDGWSAVV